MHISWLGQTCIRLQTKYKDEDVVTVIDPYKPDTGEFPRSLSTQLGLFSKTQENTISLGQSPFIMDTLGECEIKEVMVTAFPTTDGTIIFKINAEQLSVVHLGRMHSKPDLVEMEKIGSVDILLVPVGGGKEYLNAEDAASIVTALEPRIVIPIAYQCDSDPSAKPITDFIKEMGLKPDATDKSLLSRKKIYPKKILN
jgi:L-ascorbate metabolism protein UlaG (beta-lactamase superfamily)